MGLTRFEDVARPLPERATTAAALSFAVFGFIYGIYEVLLANLRTALHLSPAALGLALTIGAAGSLPAMVAGGRISDRFGANVLVCGTAAVMAAAFLGVSVVGSYLPLVVLLLCFAAASGAYDVGINAAAIDAEQTSGDSLLPYFHAAYSGFAAVGAVTAGAVLGRHVSFRWLYVGIASVLALYVVLVVTTRPLPEAGTDSDDGETGDDSRISPFRMPLVLLVAVVVCLAFFCEGTLSNWSTIYLRSGLGIHTALGASGVAVFHTSMLVGRLATARVVTRVSRRRLLVGSGALGAVGMTLALATTMVPLVLIGFAMVGLAMAVVAPLGFSLAGDLAPEQSGQASSVVTFVGYGAFLVGPALVGGVADVASLRIALAMVIAASVGIFLLSSILPSRVDGDSAESVEGTDDERIDRTTDRSVENVDD